MDRSQAAHLTGGSQWDCPFPSEADEAGIDHAAVLLDIAVSAEMQVTGVVIVKDPGYGFGREAQRCARRKHWAAAVDRAGNPIAAAARVNVKFDR